MSPYSSGFGGNWKSDFELWEAEIPFRDVDIVEPLAQAPG